MNSSSVRRKEYCVEPPGEKVFFPLISPSFQSQSYPKSWSRRLKEFEDKGYWFFGPSPKNKVQRILNSWIWIKISPTISSGINGATGAYCDESSFFLSRTTNFDSPKVQRILREILDSSDFEKTKKDFGPKNRRSEYSCKCRGQQGFSGRGPTTTI